MDEVSPRLARRKPAGDGVSGGEPHVVLADDADGFIAAVEEALAHTSPSNVAARQELAAANTWETRTQRLLELVATQL